MRWKAIRRAWEKQQKSRWEFRRGKLDHKINFTQTLKISKNPDADGLAEKLPDQRK